MIGVMEAVNGMEIYEFYKIGELCPKTTVLNNLEVVRVLRGYISSLKILFQIIRRYSLNTTTGTIILCSFGLPCSMSPVDLRTVEWLALS
jgi:hypothetical protein